MADNLPSRERIRSLAVIMGTAFQRSFLRFSNFIIVGFTLAALVMLPSVLTAPIVIAGILLFGGNTFLGATDEDLLAQLLEDFGEEHARALSLPVLTAGDGAPSSSSSAASSTEPRLKGRGRELYQRLVKCRKELTTVLTANREALAGIDTDDVEARLDGLQNTFRALASRRGQFEALLQATSAATLLKEADELAAKSEAATSEVATRDFARAAEDKRRHAETLQSLSTGIEDIEAKLQHILSSLEGYRARVVALSARSTTDGGPTQADIDHIVTGLTDEAEDLERMLEVLGS